VRSRTTIAFSVFATPPAEASTAAWTVLDPVTTDNNVVSSWAGYSIDEFADWFEDGRDRWARTMRMDAQGQDSACLTELVLLFGSAFRSHCGDE
jgi:hypothetical protein